jgi:anaerobic magnesium-protoporphyrin IX monomethyl ester cyclase
MATTVTLQEEIDLSARAPGRPLRIVLLGLYNYTSHGLRIFHPLLEQRGHEVHSVYCKDSFTFGRPFPHEEDMVVERIKEIRPDLVAVQVWSTYYQLAARLTRRIKEATGAVVVWGGIHAQVRPEQSLQDADVVCRSEGEYVLAEIADRMSLGRDFSDVTGCWVKRGDEILRNPPRFLISDLDLLPLQDVSPRNKHYLGDGQWRDAEKWDAARTTGDVMTVRGCPFECTFCIHNYTRKVTSGLGTYIRRRSVDHVMRELRAIAEARPRLQAIAISDDIFAPTRPWLEEFCARYKKEIGVPFVIWAFPRMVDEDKVKMMKDAGLYGATMGIQSGSERIRRDYYERETSDEEIVGACELFARHGIVRNLDFIGDNPYETEEDRRATVNLLVRLPKPFYFNYFPLTYFPGVDLTERAIRDGHVTPETTEDVAEKGYEIWGGVLSKVRSLDELRWDVAYMMAVYRFPGWLIHRLLDSALLAGQVHRTAGFMRRLRSAANLKARIRYKVSGDMPFPSAS